MHDVVLTVDCNLPNFWVKKSGKRLENPIGDEKYKFFLHDWTKKVTFQKCRKSPDDCQWSRTARTFRGGRSHEEMETKILL